MKIEIDLTAAADKELTRISEQTGISKPMVIQKAFNLFRAYLTSRDGGEEWAVIPGVGEIDYNELPRVVVPGIK